MKTDKALLSFGDFTTLTEYQLSRLQKIFTHVYISCKNKDKFDFDASFIEDKDTQNYAPTSGFIASFEYLQCERYFVISVDTPFISKETILQIIDHDTKDCDATIASLDSKLQPMCGIYHASLYPRFQTMFENNTHKLTALLQNNKTNSIDFHVAQEFLNLNNPQDYQEALSLI